MIVPMMSEYDSFVAPDSRWYTTPAAGSSA
jgi:hypothetical protein